MEAAGRAFFNMHLNYIIPLALIKMGHPEFIFRGEDSYSNGDWSTECLSQAVLITLRSFMPVSRYTPLISAHVSYMGCEVVPLSDVILAKPPHSSEFPYPEAMWRRLEAGGKPPLIIGFVIKDTYDYNDDDDDDGNCECECRFTEMCYLDLPFPTHPPPIPNRASEEVEIRLAEQRLLNSIQRVKKSYKKSREWEIRYGRSKEGRTGRLYL